MYAKFSFGWLNVQSAKGTPKWFLKYSVILFTYSFFHRIVGLVGHNKDQLGIAGERNLHSQRFVSTEPKLGALGSTRLVVFKSAFFHPVLPFLAGKIPCITGKCFLISWENSRKDTVTELPS